MQVKYGRPNIHGMVYEIKTGQSKKLDIDFKKNIKEKHSHELFSNKYIHWFYWDLFCIFALILFDLKQILGFEIFQYDFLGIMMIPAIMSENFLYSQKYSGGSFFSLNHWAMGRLSMHYFRILSGNVYGSS